jgi:hypothetical protein
MQLENLSKSLVDASKPPLKGVANERSWEEREIEVIEVSERKFFQRSSWLPGYRAVSK